MTGSGCVWIIETWQGKSEGWLSSTPHKDLNWQCCEECIYSFMDGFLGYNQIKMAKKDKEKTTFVMPWGTFCYKVMSSRLRNADATYQRAMVILFHDIMHREMKVYVDDILARLKKEHEQLLRKLFARLRKLRLRLNPVKCSFGVRTTKLLGFGICRRLRWRKKKEVFLGVWPI